MSEAISEDLVSQIEEAVRNAVFAGHRLGDIKDPIEGAFWKAYHQAAEEKAKDRSEESADVAEVDANPS
jgi:hypothetical protein